MGKGRSWKDGFKEPCELHKNVIDISVARGWRVSCELKYSETRQCCLRSKGTFARPVRKN